MEYTRQKNQEKVTVDGEQQQANDAAQQARQTLQNSEKEMKTLQDQFTQFNQEKNQLEQQLNQATSTVEETKYANTSQFEVISFFFTDWNKLILFILIV